MKRLLHPLSPATGAIQFENALGNYIDPTFSATVIAWQKQHGRHALPWQNTRDAYLIWLSEIMLQQTQVTAVLGYYARFLERFPTLRDLAAAPVEDVMAQWSGLGYYTRARNLHSARSAWWQNTMASFPATRPCWPTCPASAARRRPPSPRFPAARARPSWTATSSACLRAPSALMPIPARNGSRKPCGAAPKRCCRRLASKPTRRA